jgi:hypothetical protein
MRTGNETPILDKLHSKDTVVRDFTTEIMAHKKDIELNYTLKEDQRRKFDHPADQEDVRPALLRQMCERLAVIGIDFLQNQSISSLPVRKRVMTTSQSSTSQCGPALMNSQTLLSNKVFCTRSYGTGCYKTLN